MCWGNWPSVSHLASRFQMMSRVSHQYQSIACLLLPSAHGLSCRIHWKDGSLEFQLQNCRLCSKVKRRVPIGIPNVCKTNGCIARYQRGRRWCSWTEEEHFDEFDFGEASRYRRAVDTGWSGDWSIWFHVSSIWQWYSLVFGKLKVTTDYNFTCRIAGSNTTSATTTLLFYHLLHALEITAKCVAEVDGNLPPLGPDQPAYSVTDVETSLPFLRQCIRQNFRITSAFTMPLTRRVTAQEGIKISGRHIKQGVSRSTSLIYPLIAAEILAQTSVAVCNHAFHHIPDVWGTIITSSI